MLTKHENCTLTAKVGELRGLWCVAEYFIRDPRNLPGVSPAIYPPISLFLIPTRLDEAFTLVEANRNSEWRRVVTPDHDVLIMIHRTGDRVSCMSEQARMIHARPDMPQCNLRGYNAFAQTRMLICNNGETYSNQNEAARLLGISQSHISRHLKGDLRSVKGYTFAYKDR